jgi:hypothetical protein
MSDVPEARAPDCKHGYCAAGGTADWAVCDYAESDIDTETFRYCQRDKNHDGPHYMGKAVRVDI